jgi:hypothetical protein
MAEAMALTRSEILDCDIERACAQPQQLKRKLREPPQLLEAGRLPLRCVRRCPGSPGERALDGAAPRVPAAAHAAPQLDPARRARGPGGAGDDVKLTPEVEELLHGPRYYRGTCIPLAGWFHPCAACRCWTATLVAAPGAAAAAAAAAGPADAAAVPVCRRCAAGPGAGEAGREVGGGAGRDAPMGGQTARSAPPPQLKLPGRRAVACSVAAPACQGWPPARPTPARAGRTPRPAASAHQVHAQRA